MSTLIKLENAGVRYRLKRPVNGSKDFWGIKDVSLELHQGETLGVIGSNGAGKSTLMKLLSGTIGQDRGKFYKKPGTQVILLSIGAGFEGTLTGRENAILSGMLLGLHRRTILKRLPRIIEFSGLGEFIDQPLYTYSSGMHARLGFSVAMEANPDVLLLDEIMGVGDLEFAQKSELALQEKVKSDMTIVLISHSAKVISSMCTRATWIHHGVTQSTGEVEEIGQQYIDFTMGKKPLPIPEK